jgi:hypothetical protein
MRQLLLLFLSVFIISCASQTRKEITVEKQEVKVETREQMIDMSRKILSSAKGISEKQRDLILALHIETMEEVAKLNSEIRKSKIVLMKTLVQKKYNHKKGTILTKDIKKLYNKKVDLMLSSMEKAQKILGVEYAKVMNENMYDFDIIR